MVESQVEILRSENIALAVIKQLHLTDDPEFVGFGGGLIGSAYGTVSDLSRASWGRNRNLSCSAARPKLLLSAFPSNALA